MISVLIPSRNEFLLAKTIESILEAAEGEIEIIAVLDGCWDKPKVKDDSRVILIHHDEPIGQRKAVNEAARLAKGKYILKTDAHSTFDKGFDLKLAADCEYDWTVIPRMYNLHAFDWVCKNDHRFYQDKANPHKGNKCPQCGEKLKIEFVWKIRKHKRTDFMHIDSNLKVKYWNSYNKRPESKGKIVDIMNGIGACWFQHRERFLELGGLDEAHGKWGQVGVEVACKAWLSGGRHVVNKNTWFSHMFRTTGEFSFPYKNPGRDQRKAEKYSRDLWLNNKWPMQKRDFQWLIDKFSPVPTWETKIESNGEFIMDTMVVNQLFDDRMKYCERGKTRAFYERYNRARPNIDETEKLKASPKKAIENFFSSFQPFARNILDGRELKIENTDYYQYLLSHLNPRDLLPELTRKGRRHAINKAKDAIRLTKDIKDNGIKNPLDMWSDSNGNRVMRKGYRRLVILKELGVHKVGVRVWKDEETFFRNQKGNIPKRWRGKIKQ